MKGAMRNMPAAACTARPGGFAGPVLCAAIPAAVLLALVGPSLSTSTPGQVDYPMALAQRVGPADTPIRQAPPTEPPARVVPTAPPPTEPPRVAPTPVPPTAAPRAAPTQAPPTELPRAIPTQAPPTGAPPTGAAAPADAPARTAPPSEPPRAAPTATPARGVPPTQPPAPATVSDIQPPPVPSSASTTDESTTAAPAAPASARSVQTITVPLALSGGPERATFSLPGGPRGSSPGGGDDGGQIDVVVDTAALPAAATAALVFDPRPPVGPEHAVTSFGQATPIGDAIDVQLRIETADSTGSPGTGTPDVLDPTAAATISLPAEPDESFAWLIGLTLDGIHQGWIVAPLRLELETGTIDVPPPERRFDPATGAHTYELRLPVALLQGTLFLPAMLAPAHVQNHDPLVRIWSGPTRGARDFGFSGPQFTTFTVVAPQVALRLFVYSPVVNDYGWIDVAGVGPSGPP